MARLIAPTARVTIGENVFQSGDGRLISVTATIGEDDRSSSVTFTSFDPQLKIANVFFKTSYANGGILVPPDLLSEQTASSGGAGGGKSASGKWIISADTSQPAEVRAFVSLISYTEGSDYDIQYTGSRFSGYSDHPRQLKSGGGFTSDAAGLPQFLSTTWDGVKNKLALPDFSPVSQDKGCVELLKETGAYGFIVQGEAGLANAISRTAATWASFPGSPYGQPTVTLAECQTIYAEALAYYKSSGSAPVAAPEPAAANSAAIGTEVVVEFGFDVSATLQAFHYIHTATRPKLGNPNTVQFDGSSVRYFLSLKKRNESYNGITFRKLTELISLKTGVKIEIDGTDDGKLYEHILQDDITDYQLLLREARENGYNVRDTQDYLILAKPSTVGEVLKIDSSLISSANFADMASESRVTSGKVAIPKFDLLTGRVKNADDTLPEVILDISSLPDDKVIGRGYESSLTVITTEEVLALRPGGIVQLPSDNALLSSSFARKWRVSSVSHTYDGTLTSKIDIYLPVKIKSKAAAAGTGGASAPAQVVPIAPAEIFGKVAPSVIQIWVNAANGRDDRTGVIVTANGYVLTSFEVMDGNNPTTCTLRDGRTMTLRKIADDYGQKLAVCKIDGATDLPVPTFAKATDGVGVGAIIYSIGHPYDKSWAHIKSTVEVNTGIIRSAPGFLGSGDQGGALINAAGEVIGIHQSFDKDGRGFSTPIESVRDFYQRKTGGTIPSPNPDGSAGAATSPQLPAPQGRPFNLPGQSGDFYVNYPIGTTSFTWGQATKNGERIPRTPQEVANIIRLADQFERTIRPLLTGTVTVTSWYRPEPYNTQAGGVSNSQHLGGKAMDIYVDNLTAVNLYSLANPAWSGGLGRYSSVSASGIIHFDIGDNRRWSF